MGLVARIGGIPEPGQQPDEVDKIPLEHFHSNLYALAEGWVTQADIIALFNLTTEDQTDLTWLIGRYNAQPNAAAKAKFVQVIREIFVLTEAGQSGFTTEAELVAIINGL